MSIPGNTWRWLALGGLWALAGLAAWLMAVQAFLMALMPGTWHLPRISKVTVTWVDRDPTSTYPENVRVEEGSEERMLSMLKAELRDLRIGDEVWILQNYYATELRPAHFRLTPLRLLLEYPQPTLALALWGILRLRRSRLRAEKAEQEDPTRVRTVLRDDFHARALRFAAPRPPEGPAPRPDQEKP